MRKKLFLLLAGFVFVFGLALSVYGAPQKSTITFWAAAVTPERDQFFKDVVKKFEAKNPDIQVEYLGIPGDLVGYRQKWDVALASGTDPDITNDFTSKQVQMGALEPLDKYFSKWADKKLINPALVAGNRSFDPKHHRLYALPYSAQPWVMWVRPDWFKAVGLKIPETWDEFFAAVPKLTDKAKGVYGLSIRGGGGSANTLEMLMYSYSGIQNYFDKKGKSTINHPKNVEFVEKYLGLYNQATPEDDLTKGWTQLAATFQSGKAAVVIHNLGSASSHEKAFGGDRSKFMAVPFPKSIKGFRQHPGLMPLGLTMSKNSKHKEAVWKFLTFYLSNEINSAYGKLYGEIPANKNAADDAWVHDLPYMETGAQLITSPATKFGANPYYLPGYTTVQAKIEPSIQMVMLKQKTAKQMLDEWARLLEKEKADFDASLKKK
ncbi:multiple sugar transport system substrate-binding protein [Hydrogenispora ethanolica]|uniref:Multiple sugar transport system substrate-binding protein n=1 Tax=Hydrogenispora ethanolica TaxID=1082276 RepID=A0A4R1SD74_HYDET|nr:sugar ABC transporter substrate-binding protein [Hydrogenispora ethanolica]TCL76562.1 multiple sugar transport system substrate-binding protein [Hydrogenispora ethanolica]